VGARLDEKPEHLFTLAEANGAKLATLDAGIKDPAAMLIA
jgi:hypothetical protein